MQPNQFDDRLVRLALGPTSLTGNLEVGRPHHTAAGVTAVLKSTQQIIEHGSLSRGLPLLRDLNQHGGFDCPSCAWPDPRGQRSFAEFCENGAKAVADAGQRIGLTPQQLAQRSNEEWATLRDKDLNAAGRLTAPAIKRPGDDRYRPISWDDAFRVAADILNDMPPDAATFYTSGRASNEAAFLFQLFVRAHGTNNLPDCSNMCHESSGVAMATTIGVGKGTVQLEDFDRADVIVVMGQNPGTNHPRMLTALQHAVERGATVVSINPQRETGLQAFRNPQDFKNPRRIRQAIEGTTIASMFMDVRVGGDLALLTAVQKVLVERDRAGESTIDHDFVERHTVGHDDLVAALDAVEFDHLERESGIRRDQVEQLADLLASTDRIIFCWAMGLTQHLHAVDTLRQIVNLSFLRGSIGKEGAGLCPVRGHSNVQGDRSVGIHDKPSQEFLDKLAAGVGGDFSPPREHGLDVVESIHAMAAGSVQALVCLGGNFLGASPDTMVTAAAMERTRLTVHLATKLNRGHLVTGETSLLLPCLARTDVDIQAGGEQFVTCENSMGIVTTSRGTVKPVSADMRSEPAIIAGLAAATIGPDNPVDWDLLVADYDRIRDLIEACIDDFAGYNAAVRTEEGLELHNTARHLDFSGMPNGRAVLTGAEVPTLAVDDDVLVLMTIRSHDQFNTTVYDNNDRYRGIHGERRVVLVNAQDLAARGLIQGDVVDLVSADGRRRAETFVCLPYELPRGNCAAYYPETNVLVDINAVALESNTPISKHVPIRLQRPHR